MVKFLADLVGIVMPETSFSMHPPVTEVRLVCDGKRAEMTVTLGSFDSEADGRVVADAAMMRVWGALLVGMPGVFASAGAPTQVEAGFELPAEQGVLNVAVTEVVLLSDRCEATITPAAEQVERVRAIALAPSWKPSESVVFDRYARALRESDPVAQFLALYEAANLAIEAYLGEEEELLHKTFDAEIRKFDPSTPNLPIEGRSKANETPFTRARNRLLHPRGRGVAWPEASAYAAQQLGPFRSLVAGLVAREAAIPP